MQNIKISILLSIFISFFLSCNYFKKEKKEIPIASIKGKNLYQDAIENYPFKGLEKEDSLLQMQHFIEQWAYKQLMIAEAKKNIDTLNINKLVEEYKNDLILETYQNQLAEKNLDTQITNIDLKKTYEKLKNLYPARDIAVKTNLLIVNKKNNHISQYKKWFFSTKNEEKDSLLNHENDLKKLQLEDSWQYLSQLKEKYPALKRIPDHNIIKKSKKIIISDSLDLYLIFIKDFLDKNEKLPMEFIKPELKQIILNKRKQKWIENLKNEIIEKAIEKKELKIYNNKLKK